MKPFYCCTIVAMIYFIVISDIYINKREDERDIWSNLYENYEVLK